MSRLDSAKGDGDGENDRKECFHGTNVSLPLTRVRLPVRRYARRHDDRSPRESTAETQPQLQPALLRLSAMIPLLTRKLLLLRSTNGNKEPKRDAVPKFV
jgi:hypothetical protein